MKYVRKQPRGRVYNLYLSYDYVRYCISSQYTCCRVNSTRQDNSRKFSRLDQTRLNAHSDATLNHTPTFISLRFFAIRKNENIVREIKKGGRLAGLGAGAADGGGGDVTRSMSRPEQPMRRARARGPSLLTHTRLVNNPLPAYGRTVRLEPYIQPQSSGHRLGQSLTTVVEQCVRVEIMYHRRQKTTDGIMGQVRRATFLSISTTDENKREH